MPATGSDLLDGAALADLFERARQGSVEILGALDGQPMLVVDLDRPTRTSRLDIPPAFGSVVVGISRTGASGERLSGVDVAITEADRSARPWVSVADLDDALDAMAVAVQRSPMASVALVQVLRSGRPDSLDHDLLLESLAYSTLQGGPEFARWLAATPTTPATPTEVRSLVVERSGGRLSLTFDRPRVRNAYNRAMRDELCEALAVACADPSIREVHLHGSGPDFCSGGDLGEFGTLPDPAAAHLIRTSRNAARLLAVVGDRTVAHLHGACVGAGVELPALAAGVVARPDARLRLPEVAMGLIPGAGGTATLPRRIGRHRTGWLALTGRFISADTGRDWGLIDEIREQ
jgi:hypothetical protein